jgi:V/A-type H+-transporting ATPase subunit I
MIVPMRSVTVLCLLADQERALKTLQHLGVLHPAPVVTPDSEALEAARDRLAAAREALETLAGEGAPSGVPAVEESGNAAALVAQVHDGQRRERELKTALETLERERAAVSPLGQFEPADARRLEAGGVRVRFFQVAGEIPGGLPAGTVVRVLGGDKASRVVAVIGREAADFPGVELALPARSLREVEEELARTRQALERNTEALTRLRGGAGLIRRWIARLEEEEAFLRARDGMGQWERITYLRGYCPAESVPALREGARREGWGLLVREPAADEAVPTLLRNPAWVRPIQAIFDLIGILPGYRELDVSTVFLLFYSLFFAMLVGDAGYGAIFLGLTVAIWRWAPKAPRQVPLLLAILSGSTILWGVLTGSYFGIRTGLLPAPLQAVSLSWLKDDGNLMQLCFLIGCAHLTIAHGWVMAREGLRLVSVAQAGWIAVVWTMYFLTMTMILDRPMPAFVLPMFLAGVSAVLLFLTPLKALKTEWPNHLMLPLTVVGYFGDVVSYVRLFAVGSAGTAISVAFNEMAVGDGVRGLGDGLVAALILFLAHGLNILLAGLGVIVHGVRLNTLEFSGHLGMQWVGLPFRPFRKEGGDEGAKE